MINSRKDCGKVENKMYAYWLCNVPGVGNRTIDKLLELFQTPKQIYNATEKALEQVLKPAQLENMKRHKMEWKLWQEYETLEKKGIRFLLREESEYPLRLRNIPDAPYGIFVKGLLPWEHKMSVAIIGARDCSEYGRYVAESLGKCMGENEIQVISGMARGIDGISQAAALKAGGTSIAVLGSGVDVCYPVSNRGIYEKIQERGAVLSICPPGTPPLAQNFPQRNRVVSGLADAVVVIEARQKSGTLITVDMALEQGKEVYVVPGRITDRLSDGCNKLLKQGAGVLLSPEEFLAEIRELWQKQNGERNNEKENGLQGSGRQKAVRKTRVGLRIEDEVVELCGGQQKGNGNWEIYVALDFYPQSLEQIQQKLQNLGATPMPIAMLNAALMRLCLENLAVQVSPGHFCRSGRERKEVISCK